MPITPEAPSPLRLCVTTAGSHARRLMDAAAPGTVIAVFARSLYIRDESGRIACFGGPGLGEGPLNALCTAWPDRAVAAAGATAGWHRGLLQLSDTTTFDPAITRLWQPATPGAWQSSTLARGIERLAATPARGLGTAIPTLVGGAPLPTGDRFHVAALNGLLALASWLRDPADEPPAVVASLIGLGPGLTPAGDDALGGALVALRLFGAIAIADRLASWVMPRARPATSDISFAHLAAAAEGEGAAALHDTLVATARDDASLAGAVARLDRIGHSSGWDALAGAVAALASLASPVQ